jgi:hypothetical protein
LPSAGAAVSDVAGPAAPVAVATFRPTSLASVGVGCPGSVDAAASRVVAVVAAGAAEGSAGSTGVPPATETP